METASKRSAPLATGLRALRWGALLALLWWAVIEGREGSTALAVPVVVVAALVAARVIPPVRRFVRPLALARFFGFFVLESWKGGLDVARRALSRDMGLAPGFVELRTRLPEGAARVLFVDTISLLPGTLTVELDGERVLVHALDSGPAFDAGVRALEREIERLFGAGPGGGGR